MPAFVVQHIDAIVTTTLGLWMTIFAWRRREQLRASPQQFVRAIPMVAPAIIVFGVFLFMVSRPPPKVVYEWQRAFTVDKRASAEFPASPRTETATDSAQGISVRRWSVICAVPQRDIDLRLLHIEIPEGVERTEDEQLNAIRSFLEQRFIIISCVREDLLEVPSYRLVTETKSGKGRSLSRIAITQNAIYRAVATSTSGFHDDPAIDRFLGSFNVREFSE